MIDAHGHFDLRAIVQGQHESAVAQRRDDPPHAFLGVVLHMAHILHHRIAPVPLHDAVEFLNPLFVGGNLGAQVGDVLPRIARRVAAATEQLEQRLFAEFSALHQFEVVDEDPFFRDVGRERRH